MDRSARAQRIALVIGVVVASLLVWKTSEAAFTDTTVNPGNSFDAGTVTLTDDLSGTAMFSVTGLVPGDSNTGCIEVSYTGSVTPGSAVDFYASSSDTISGGDGLTDDLDVTLELGQAASTCASFTLGSTLYDGTVALASLATSGSPLSTGWTPAPGSDTMRPFRFTVTLGADTANDAQGEGASASFTWAVSS